MTARILYRFKINNHTVDSLIKPDGEYIERLRLIADEDKLLTKDGEKTYTVIDIDKPEQPSWYEIEQPAAYALRHPHT